MVLVGWRGEGGERRDKPDVYSVCAAETYDVCAWSGFDEVVDFAVGH